MGIIADIWVYIAIFVSEFRIGILGRFGGLNNFSWDKKTSLVVGGAIPIKELLIVEVDRSNPENHTNHIP